MTGYTRKVGLRKPVLECTKCWISDIPCTHPDLARTEIQERRRHRALAERTLNVPLPPADPYWTDEDRIALGVECLLCHDAAAGHDRTVPPDHDCGEWERIIDCAECGDDSALEALADRMEAERARTSVRRLNEQALAREAYDAACPHCACYMHAECCYCDGGQVHK